MLARSFADDVGPLRGLAEREGRTVHHTLRHIRARTAFFDDAVLRAIERGLTQVVILGAGYDGRALRFRTPGVQFFEVDHPATQADKRGRLARLHVGTDGISFVPADFTEPGLEERLADAGHRAAEPTQFLLEGVLRYLPEAAVRNLLTTARRLAAGGSELAVSISTRLPTEDHDGLAARSAAEQRLADVGEAVLTVPSPRHRHRLARGCRLGARLGGRPRPPTRTHPGARDHLNGRRRRLTGGVLDRCGWQQDGGMHGGSRPDRRPLSRADLPAELTPETVRRLDAFTVRRLSQPGNGILTADEQRSFDQALRSVMQDTTDRLDQSLRRVRRGGPGGLDPELRRSYARTEERLAAQARRVRRSFPQLTDDWDETVGLPEPAASDEHDDAISLGALESEIEQTSDTLEILERIASIQQQQLEHQRTQVLRDVRGVCFALLVSVAVIVAGVTPLVQAEPHERRLIVLWTLVVCGVAGAVYAVVRAAQSNRSPKSD